MTPIELVVVFDNTFSRSLDDRWVGMVGLLEELLARSIPNIAFNFVLLLLPAVSDRVT